MSSLRETLMLDLDLLSAPATLWAALPSTIQIASVKEHTLQKRNKSMDCCMCISLTLHYIFSPINKFADKKKKMGMLCSVDLIAPDSQGEIGLLMQTEGDLQVDGTHGSLGCCLILLGPMVKSS